MIGQVRQTTTNDAEILCSIAFSYRVRDTLHRHDKNRYCVDVLSIRDIQGRERREEREKTGREIVGRGGGRERERERERETLRQRDIDRDRQRQTQRERGGRRSQWREREEGGEGGQRWKEREGGSGERGGSRKEK